MSFFARKESRFTRKYMFFRQNVTFTVTSSEIMFLRELPTWPQSLGLTRARFHNFKIVKVFFCCCCKVQKQWLSARWAVQDHHGPPVSDACYVSNTSCTVYIELIHKYYQVSKKINTSFYVYFLWKQTFLSLFQIFDIQCMVSLSMKSGVH